MRPEVLAIDVCLREAERLTKSRLSQRWKPRALMALRAALGNDFVLKPIPSTWVALAQHYVAGLEKAVVDLCPKYKLRAEDVLPIIRPHLNEIWASLEWNDGQVKMVCGETSDTTTLKQRGEVSQGICGLRGVFAYDDELVGLYNCQEVSPDLFLSLNAERIDASEEDRRRQLIIMYGPLRYITETKTKEVMSSDEASYSQAGGFAMLEVDGKKLSCPANLPSMESVMTWYRCWQQEQK